jgi:hypothetical protein
LWHRSEKNSISIAKEQKQNLKQCKQLRKLHYLQTVKQKKKMLQAINQIPFKDTPNRTIKLLEPVADVRPFPWQHRASLPSKENAGPFPASYRRLSHMSQRSWSRFSLFGVK